MLLLVKNNILYLNKKILLNSDVHKNICATDMFFDIFTSITELIKKQISLYQPMQDKCVF